jgi:glycosyltransferase involved in cell wall biosynthesis
VLETILFVGHAGSPTGFARVLDSIIGELPGDYRVHRFATDAESAPGWMPALPEAIARLRPDAVVVLDEPWVCARLAPQLCGSPDFLTIFYGAADGEESVTAEIAAQLARADCYVAFQQFGRDLVERHFAEIAARPACVEVIPHGVDTALFHPVDKQAARREVFGTRALDDAFIVLNANRNQLFKRIDLCVEGFALFARDKPPNVKLCLHMGTREAEPGETALADRFGVRDRLLLTGRSEHHPGVSSERLNLIYNACDAGVNTSEKEGWGLIAFEHAATRAPQIVPRHTACAELWEGAALLLDPAKEDSMVRYQHAGRTVTVDGVAAAFERLYSDPAERERLAAAAFARATEPRYSWEAIAAQWDALFRRMSAPRASSA